jgi:pilus assembly protein CpaB
MGRTRLFIVLALAVTLGGAFAFGTYRYVDSSAAASPALETRPVVVAAVPLDVGDALGPGDVRVIDWPAASVPSGAFAEPGPIVGRGVITPIARDEPILPAKLALPEAGAGLPPAIPEGLRAVSVRVNEVIGVAGYVLPGTRVDVLATINPTHERTDVTSKVILTNVQVLAAGTRIERAADKDKPVAVSVVTLLVNPAEAERLTLAATEGQIQLALRNPLDTSRPQTAGVRPAALLGYVPPARPAAPRPRVAVPRATQAPEPPPTIEIIRGDKREHEPVRQESRP